MDADDPPKWVKIACRSTAMMVTKIMRAALSRADVNESERKPFYLYVDEFHNFLTLSFANILSESRKYGLNLILAHQYIEQLDDKITTAVFGNVGTIISFRVGAEVVRRRWGRRMPEICGKRRL